MTINRLAPAWKTYDEATAPAAGEIQEEGIGSGSVETTTDGDKENE